MKIYDVALAGLFGSLADSREYSLGSMMALHCQQVRCGAQQIYSPVDSDRKSTVSACRISSASGSVLPRSMTQMTTSLDAVENEPMKE